MTVLKIFIRSLKVSEPRKIIVLQSHTLSGRLICQYPRIHNVLESHPHNYTRTGKGKKKNQFWKFWCKMHPIQSKLGHLFQRLPQETISKVLSGKILTELGWPRGCAPCYFCHSHPSFCPGYQNTKLRKLFSLAAIPWGEIQ